MSAVMTGEISQGLFGKEKAHPLSQGPHHRPQFGRLEASKVFRPNDAEHWILDIINRVHFDNRWVHSDDSRRKSTDLALSRPDGLPKRDEVPPPVFIHH